MRSLGYYKQIETTALQKYEFENWKLCCNLIIELTTMILWAKRLCYILYCTQSSLFSRSCLYWDPNLKNHRITEKTGAHPQHGHGVQEQEEINKEENRTRSENCTRTFETWRRHRQIRIREITHTSVGIFPRTFPIFKSRDFWTFVPGQRDHGTFKVSRSCPV